MLGLPGFAAFLAGLAVLYLAIERFYRRKTIHRDWHRDVLAVGALVLAVIGFYWPLFFTQSWIPKGGGDLSSFIYPTYSFAARWLKQGVIPLWNPHLYMGMPFAADNQSGLFYPLNLAFFLLTPDLTYAAVELMAVTHVWMAGLFTYILLRSLPALGGSRRFQGEPSPVGRVAAVAGAIVYMFSDVFVTHPGNLNIIATAAWMPLSLWVFRQALVRKSWGWAAWTGVVLGTAALVGHAQMFLYNCMALGILALVSAYEHRREGRSAVLLRLGLLVVAGLVSGGLAAVALLPAYEMTPYTVRASMTYAEASAFALPPEGLIGLFAPGFWGRATGEFWGPWLRTEVGYAGVLPMMLAAIAVALTMRRSALTRFCVFLGLLGLLVALGDRAVLHGWTFALLPFFRQLRVPARAVVMLNLAVAVLAAVGLDLLLRPLTHRQAHALMRVERSLAWGGGGLAVVGLPLLAQAVVLTRTWAADVRAQVAHSLGSAVLALLWFAGGLAGLALRRHRVSSRAVLGVLAVGWIALDLIGLGAYVEIEPNDPLVGYRHDKALAFLRSDAEVFRVETAAEVQGGWAPDWALLEGMDDWGGIWNPLRLGAYDVLTWVGIQREDRLYDFYNVKYLIARRDTPVPEHFGPVFEEGERVIYRNDHVLPRAFIVHRAQVVGGDIDALNLARSPDVDLSTEVILKQDGGALALDVDADDGQDRVEIIGRSPNRLEFRAVNSAAGYLVTSEIWLPGWVAYVDGARADVLKANYTFRAVYLEPGDHEVRMVYRPVVWYAGAGLSLLTVSILCGWGLWSALRRRRSDRGRRAGNSVARPVL